MDVHGMLAMDVAAVISLGFVGLPLAVAFGKILPTIGYGLAAAKLDSYSRHVDPGGSGARVWRF